ncbi:MAG: hypothetical protein A2X48_15170 [Lentisphaerae bacterium GWF2_49_21]|nr:MAG: hypothetical protein A2X48_15170 [Lentisphaerae bacterium GWF2_49_21]
MDNKKEVNLSCSLSREFLDINWKGLNEDYNGTMFDIVTVCFQGHSVKLLGFEPSIHQILYYTRYTSGYDFTYVLLYIPGSYSTGYLCIVIRAGQAFLLETLDSRGNAESSTITTEQVGACLYRVPELFLKSDENKIYVSSGFYKDLKEHEIKLPDNYMPLQGFIDISKFSEIEKIIEERAKKQSTNQRTDLKDCDPYRYEVQEGDTWEDIAAMHGVKIDELRAANKDVMKLEPEKTILTVPHSILDENDKDKK